MSVLTDEMWARVEPVLPPLQGAMGRPMREHRSLVEGAIYRYRTGIAWRDLPAEFARRRSRAAVGHRGDTRSSQRLPGAAATPGRAARSPPGAWTASNHVDRVAGGQGLLGSRTPRSPADSGHHRGHPQPSDQIRHRTNKGSRGGRPVGFDAADYKNRNVVERAFNHFENWRGLATRYDKHALIYRGATVLAAMLWLT